MIDGKPKLKGILIVPDGAPIPFAYNPSEIRETRGVSYAEKNGIGMSHPHLHYQHGTGNEISWTMTVRDKMNVGGVKMPLAAEAFIASLMDLTFPIHKGGMMVDGPPALLFVFQIYIKYMRITNIEVTRKEWDQNLSLKRADISLTTKEVVFSSKQRINSLQHLKYALRGS